MRETPCPGVLNCGRSVGQFCWRGHAHESYIRMLLRELWAARWKMQQWLQSQVQMLPGVPRWPNCLMDCLVRPRQPLRQWRLRNISGPTEIGQANMPETNRSLMPNFIRDSSKCNRRDGDLLANSGMLLHKREPARQEMQLRLRSQIPMLQMIH